MLAELHYPEVRGQTQSILSDIAKLMTGTSTLASLSSYLDKTRSTLTGAPGTWVEIPATSNTDLHNGVFYPETVPRLFRQPAYYSGKTKYLKFAISYNASSAVFLYGVEGALVTSPSLGPLLETNVVNGNQKPPSSMVTVGSGNVNTFAGPLVVKLLVTNNLFIIMFGANGKSFNKPACVFDFNPNIIPSALTSVNSIVMDSTFIGKMAAISHSGQPYRLGSIMRFAYGPFVDISILTSPLFKNAGFTNTGSKNWLIPLAINQVSINKSRPEDPAEIHDYQLPWTDISDGLKLWLTNSAAFGDNGDTFQTELGTLCKFGNLMCEVR